MTGTGRRRFPPRGQILVLAAAYPSSPSVLARGILRPGRLLATAALLALFGALALPAAAQDQTAVLVSNTEQRSLVTSGLDDNDEYAQTFTVGANDGNYTLSSIEAEITNGRVSSADMVLLTVAIWSTHASGENAGHPDSPLYTLTKPASIASGESLVRFGAPPQLSAGGGQDVCRGHHLQQVVRQ